MRNNLHICRERIDKKGIPWTLLLLTDKTGMERSLLQRKTKFSIIKNGSIFECTQTRRQDDLWEGFALGPQPHRTQPIPLCFRLKRETFSPNVSNRFYLIKGTCEL